MDLDREMKIGEDIAVLTEPFGRLLNKEDGSGVALTANQVLGQRLLPSALSTTPFYVLTSLMRLNHGVEITLSS